MVFVHVTNQIYKAMCIQNGILHVKNPVNIVDLVPTLVIFVLFYDKTMSPVLKILIR